MRRRWMKRRIGRNPPKIHSLGLMWGSDEPDDIFKGEPADEYCFGNLKEVLLP